METYMYRYIIYVYVVNGLRFIRASPVKCFHGRKKNSCIGMSFLKDRTTAHKRQKMPQAEE